MKLYWCPQTRAQRAVWMLEEAGVEYERAHIDIRDENREPNPDFLAASPMGKVPALEDGDLRMSESAAICLYVADRYSSGALAPALDAPERGKFLYWMFYTPAVIEPAMSEKIRGAEPNRLSNGWGDFDSMIATLETGIAGKTWIMGEEFTAADIMVGGAISFLRMFNMLPESESLNSYADRCEQRPAYRKAVSLEG